MAQMQEVRGVHTSIHTDDAGVTHVVYRGTQVVSFDAQTITLRTGGWKSNTTKTRMMQAAYQFGLGFSVYQKDFEWFIDTAQKEKQTFDGDTVTIDRKTGIVSKA